MWCANARKRFIAGCATSISKWYSNRPKGHNRKEKSHGQRRLGSPKERINVTFKPATGGAQEEIELPLKLLAIGDYTLRADDRKIEDRKPISIDKMTFDEVLAKQELS
jgi:predicted component of type VI protein secretion system